MYYIYSITDINGNFVYIGITKNNLDTRLEQHKKDEKRKKKFEWLKKNPSFIQSIDTANSREEAEIKEESYINSYLRKGYKLLNKNKISKEIRMKQAIEACNRRIEEVKKGL